MNRAALFALLLVGGCGPLVQIGGNVARPEALYTISAAYPAPAPAGAISAGQPPVGQPPVDMTKAVSIDVPQVPGALQTLRIPVVVSDTSIQYVREASWAEQPNRLFQRLLADTLVNSGIAVIDQRSSGKAGGRRLTGQLKAFGADVRDGRLVRVRFDATLIGPDGVRQRRFEHDAPVARIDGAHVSAALNSAANAVAADVSRWIGSSD
ncbi:MAG: membrane integrity-associated transporter subunit PqiC [Sandarakinorhabdus sp.]|nr:membrane integrity-associated transporter subunit PqiC [Sandarakinorhabdus sp.]